MKFELMREPTGHDSEEEVEEGDVMGESRGEEAQGGEERAPDGDGSAAKPVREPGCYGAGQQGNSVEDGDHSSRDGGRAGEL